MQFVLAGCKQGDAPHARARTMRTHALSPRKPTQEPHPPTQARPASSITVTRHHHTTAAATIKAAIAATSGEKSESEAHPSSGRCERMRARCGHSCLHVCMQLSRSRCEQMQADASRITCIRVQGIIISTPLQPVRHPPIISKTMLWPTPPSSLQRVRV